jgi:very-short-patch-repair endonuclease
MNDEGWSVARFWNVDALTAMPSVLETIVAICDGRLAETTTAPDLRFFPARNKS